MPSVIHTGQVCVLLFSPGGGNLEYHPHHTWKALNHTESGIRNPSPSFFQLYITISMNFSIFFQFNPYPKNLGQIDF